MTASAGVLLAVAALVAMVDWWAVATKRKPVEYVAKPATLAALIGVAIALDATDGSRRAWFVAALLLSLAGDVFLMVPRDLFVAGLGAFLLGHLAYVAGFGPSEAWPWILLVAAVSVPVGAWILLSLARTARDLVAPVVLYMAVISVMVACAIGSGDALAIGGASLFYVSDATIAINRFVRPHRWAPVAIMVTYHLGQAGLVLSLA